LNDGWLTLGEGGKMKVDIDPFPVGIIELGEKKVLVRTDHARTTAGKNVIMLDELMNQMIKSWSLEARLWKENVGWRPVHKIRSTSSMLIEKYSQRQWQ
jgi:hypothetical protein